MTTGPAQELRVIARYRDGLMLKGTTHDFAPTRPSFHVTPHGTPLARPVEVPVAALKALFFVKSFEGNAGHRSETSLQDTKGQGRRVAVTFADGEVLTGFTVGYTPGKPGFFMIPADPDSNNARVFVVNGSVKKLEWIRDTAGAGAEVSPRRS